MNKFRNTIHTHLVPVGIANGNIFIHHPKGEPALDTTDICWDDKNNKLTFGFGPLGVSWNYEVKPMIIMGFSDTEVLGRKPQLGFLDEAATQIGHILTATKIECRRLGFIS